MGASERTAERGARLARRIVPELGEEIRRARVAAGLSQAAIGRPIGMSRSKVGRVERGRFASVPLVYLAKLTAVVGLELSVRVYPRASPLRDKAHADLLERLRARSSHALQWRTEVPLPNPGDLRSWDAMASGPDFRVGIEAETRARDGQELERRLALKERDGGVDRVVLLLSDTRANRAFVRERKASLEGMFPVSSRVALTALEAGLDPGGNAIILL